MINHRINTWDIRKLYGDIVKKRYIVYIGTRKIKGYPANCVNRVIRITRSKLFLVLNLNRIDGGHDEYNPVLHRDTRPIGQ